MTPPLSEVPLGLETNAPPKRIFFAFAACLVAAMAYSGGVRKLGLTPRRALSDETQPTSQPLLVPHGNGRDRPVARRAGDGFKPCAA
jgi:hypothetical protein